MIWKGGGGRGTLLMQIERRRTRSTRCFSHLTLRRGDADVRSRVGVFVDAARIRRQENRRNGARSHPEFAGRRVDIRASGWLALAATACNRCFG
ncbi:hypothetical protein BD410DRAFT_641116 [Rickenella mellea]|uniref:Uncharacterized protein n=1 Tax=Rickenella mellea TaxID=50990 RepID=A0A4Y7PMM7_9AGAM|nr:hypothetical protein BD410DRAFT_641116 [Rickenella mellea]